MHNKKRYTKPITALLLALCFIFYFGLRISAHFGTGNDIHIKNHSGDLKIENPNGGFFVDYVSGNCELNANGGPLKIGTVAGDLFAKTTAGDIEIEEAKGNIEAVTRAGNILIKKAHKYVYAETVLGEIIIHSARSVEVRNIVGGDVKLLNISEYASVSSGGNIVLVVPREISGSNLCDLKSMEGDITIWLTENFGADLEIKTPISRASTKETRIESDFSFSVLNQWHEGGQYFNMSTSINGGGPLIKLFINKGDIYIKALK